jgi:hypothetical protein
VFSAAARPNIDELVSLFVTDAVCFTLGPATRAR